MISVENCLIMKVNNHNRAYDGNICDNPRKHDCGATANFRANYCARQIKQCYDMGLFDVAHPSFYKRGRDVDVDGYVSELYQACKQGQNPLVFFYTSSGRRNILTGLYVVGQVDRYLVGYSGDDWEYTFTPLEGWALRFPDPRQDNDFLWHHTEGSRGVCHRVNRNYVATGLGILIDMYSEVFARMNLEPGLRQEREKILLKLRELLEQLALDTPTGLDMACASVGSAVASGSTKAGSLAARTGKGGSPGLATGGKTAGGVVSVAPPAAIQVQGRVLEEEQRSLQEVVARVQDEARAAGLYYSDGLIKRYHISLKTKPFVILAGISGGGKTRLVLTYARATGAELLPVAVRPDWTSNESLLGAYNILQNSFVPTPFSEFLLAAQRECKLAKQQSRQPRQYMVLLDEMNLARVEYYFSDFLSKMELPPEMRCIRFYDHPVEDPRFPREVTVPPNLSITGTVNIDETTHTFSDKVLDRSNFIKLEEIDLKSLGELFKYWQPPLVNKESAHLLVDYLSRINNILRAADQQFGYRTATEIIRWVDYALTSAAFGFYTALDYQIKQKVLAKLQVARSRRADTDMVAQLLGFFEDEKLPGAEETAFPQCREYVERLNERVREEEFILGQI
ncbi:McrB family protein [Desulforamulus hydrothermalis]|uniref:ATPase dynein-related AAA domain-containing protein n=1 Tax=Desulforamulus hydrothermalis Lam5 = DSM 18033 TaxID=1121428 RepID=K8DXU0_9FIRM|nr:AAA family ATPase [Desulforamulus hydrothermalis]CCO07552.1 hypothetical protein DESHY_110498 [Desulforamulus hydrothermalis Lam5 = DSM 18033]SHH31216.1 AAA domain (dynein-related subfamily) [Desulforamulus hydrothermalis Lam5 = DSM 18033]